jgi:hypothetical protein
MCTSRQRRLSGTALHRGTTQQRRTARNSSGGGRPEREQQGADGPKGGRSGGGRPERAQQRRMVRKGAAAADGPKGGRSGGGRTERVTLRRFAFRILHGLYLLFLRRTVRSRKSKPFSSCSYSVANFMPIPCLRNSDTISSTSVFFQLQIMRMFSMYPICLVFQ